MSHTNLVTVLAGGFSAIGAALFVMAVRHFIRKLAFVRNSAAAEGVVIALKGERDGSEALGFSYPRVRFQTTAGHYVTFESDMASPSKAWHVGEPVSVRYRPDRPDIAEFDSFAALWGATILFATLASVFLGVGIGLWLGFIPV